MQPTMSSVPAPKAPESQPPQPGPSVVPAKLPPARPRRTGLWATLIVLVIASAGTTSYLKTQADAKAATKSIASVSTAVLGLGDVTATIRVNGTVNAQNFAALLAPRIL